MSIRVFEKSSKQYIYRLIEEMETDTDYCFDIEVKENRNNGVIQELTITAKQFENIGF